MARLGAWNHITLCWLIYTLHGTYVYVYDIYVAKKSQRTQELRRIVYEEPLILIHKTETLKYLNIIYTKELSSSGRGGLFYMCSLVFR